MYLFNCMIQCKTVIVGAQMSQSAHFALQMPYIMFGLGQTPNFVQEVGVGIPNEIPSKVSLSVL